MKNQSHLALAALFMLGGTFVSSQAEKAQSTWQKWKKPVMATTMVVGGIAGWLLLDYYLNGQFNSKLNKITDQLVKGRSNSFFENNGQLRKWPNLSEEQLKNQAIVDGQLYENARFGNMVKSISATRVIGYLNDYLKGYVSFSDISNAIGFSTNLLINQVGTKLCFITSLLGGYWLLISSDTEKSDDAEAVKS